MVNFSLASKKVVKDLLTEYDIRPSKKLGQNFLVSKKILKKILQASNIKKTDVVLEIGAGMGTLTQVLAQKAKKVIAIEKDKKMIEILKQTLKDFKNVKIIQADVLKTEFKDYQLPTTNYQLISNPPYYITSPVIKKFLETKNPPHQMILMIQKEVAQRVCAKPPNMSILAIAVQFYAKAEIVSYVSKKCFWPSPQVDSAVIKIVPRIQHPMFPFRPFYENGGIPQHQVLKNEKIFFKIVRAGFSHPRKQLANSLCFKLKLKRSEVIQWLKKNRINPSQRAQTLNLQDWLNLAKTLKNIIIEK